MTYTPLKILTPKEKADLLKKLREQFGIQNIDGIFTKRGEERLFLFQGNFTQKQIQEIDQTLPIERVGVYFAKLQNNELRLSIEGAHLLKDQITKNIFELNDEQAELWMKGNELNTETGLRGFVVVKYKDNFLGCGKASENKLTNFVPKNRRLKEKN